MRTLLPALRHYSVIVALKAGLACGLAFYLGSLLPDPVGDYKYYAALGAFTVVGLVVVDSFKESLRVFAAVVIGVVAALFVQNISWTNFLTVGAAVLVCTLVAALPQLGDQRTWAPLVALFVLATGGPDPEPMVLGYLVQLPLGAVVGILVNLLVLPPLGDRDLRSSTARVLHLMAEQMRSYADLLERVDGPDPPQQEDRDSLISANVQDLTEAQTSLRAAITQGTQARRGNPRTLTRGRQQAAELERAEATRRCAATLQAVSVVIAQAVPDGSESERAMRRAVSDMLHRAAGVFAATDDGGPEAEEVSATRATVDRTLRRVRSSDVDDGPDDLIYGALALTIQDSLEIFTRHVVGDGADPDGP